MVGGRRLPRLVRVGSRLTICCRQLRRRRRAYFQGCPSRKLAAYFLMGSDDFRYRSGQPSQVQQILQRCHDETVMVVIPGGTHESTIGALSSDGLRAEDPQWLMMSYSDGEGPELSRKRGVTFVMRRHSRKGGRIVLRGAHLAGHGPSHPVGGKHLRAAPPDH